MSISDVTSGAVSSLLGVTQPAYLVVNDYRDSVPAPTATTSTSAASSAATAAASTAAKAAAAVALAAQNALAAVARLAYNMPDPPAVPENALAKYFLVQYNPSELQVNSSLNDGVDGAGPAEPRSSIQPSSSGGSKVSKASSPSRPVTTLSVKIYFDDMSTGDCFTADVGTLDSITGFVADVLDVTYSVQPYVDALIAAIRNPYTRSVSFCWSDFVFTGMLSSIAVQYTMFSPSGRPVRAEINLRIQQEHDPETSQAGWYDAFDTTFGGSTTSLSSATDAVGSVLNINL